MATNTELAVEILAAYVNVRKTGHQVVLTYGDMAKLIGRPGQQRILGGALDALRKYCEDLEIPDVATVVVNKESLLDGTLLPSQQALEKYGGWPGLRKQQAKVISFDWSRVRTHKSA
jgi:alkylated DNA nucleotide flippase Atl1